MSVLSIIRKTAFPPPVRLSAWVPLLFCFIAANLISLVAASEQSPSIADIAANNLDATVIVFGTRQDTGAEVQSSGCFLDRSGVVLSSAHQVDGLQSLVIQTRQGQHFSATVIAMDKEAELALLRSDSRPTQGVTIGDSDTLSPGARLVGISTPENLAFSIVQGIVSTTQRTYRGYPVIQAELNASSGSSGGPVFGPDGKLVGVIVGKIAEQPWFTVIAPVNNATRLMADAGLAIAPTTNGPPKNDISGGEDGAYAAYRSGIQAAPAGEKIQWYRQAVARRPAFFEAWFNLAVCLGELGDSAAAAEAYEKALAIRPDSVEVMRNFGRLEMQSGRISEALSLFQCAAELAPGAAQSYNDVGEALRRLQHFDEAAAAFALALAIHPGYAPAAYNMGLIRAARGDNHLAVESFREYLSLAPGATDKGQVQAWIDGLS